MGHKSQGICAQVTAGKAALLEDNSTGRGWTMCQWICSKSQLKVGFLSSPPFLFLLLYFHVLFSFLPIHPISWIQNRSLQKLLFWWMFSEIYNHQLLLRWNTFSLSLQCIFHSSHIWACLDYGKAAGWDLLQQCPQILLPQSWFRVEWTGITWIVYISNSWRSIWENINTHRENSNCSRNYCFSWHEWPLVWVTTS